MEVSERNSSKVCMMAVNPAYELP